MKTFVKINEVRLAKSSIKKYTPNGTNKLNVYYSPSRNKIDVETFDFPSKGKRDDMVDTLDTIFL